MSLEMQEFNLSTPPPLSQRELVLLSPPNLNQFACTSKALKVLREVGAEIDVTTIGVSAYDRRKAVLADPDILYSLIEYGWQRAALAVVFGFANGRAFSKWVRDNKLDDAVAEAERNSADLFADMAVDAYAPLEGLQDKMLHAIGMVDITMQAATGDSAAVEALRESGVVPDDATDDDARMIASIRLATLETGLNVMAKGAEAVAKLADRRFTAAMRLASTRNPSKFGGSTVGGGSAAPAQNVSISLNYGIKEDQDKPKMVNAVPGASSLPAGINIG